MMRIVLDTNVLVSAMLTGGGAPDFALQLVLQGEVTLLADSRILAEYDEVTSRARFKFDDRERRILLNVLAYIAEPVIAKPLRVSLPDADDRVFVEVAIAGGADAIVTGNTRHFIPKRGKLTVPVLSPRQLVDRLRREPMSLRRGWLAPSSIPARGLGIESLPNVRRPEQSPNSSIGPLRDRA